MSLIDRTNETIPLSLHRPMTEDFPPYVPIHPATLDVDADSDSSFDPSHWVHIALTDEEHDADRIKMTYDEAAALHDRLGRILFGDRQRVFVSGEGKWVRCTPAFLASTGGCPAGARRATEEQNNHEHWVPGVSE